MGVNGELRHRRSFVFRIIILDLKFDNTMSNFNQNVFDVLFTKYKFYFQTIQIVVKFKVTKTFMSKMRNLALLMDPCEEAYDTSLKAANMYMNRFCIDEDASFELSGVNYFQKSSDEMTYKESLEFKFKRKMKGKECSIDK